jgi:hypothetical protein
VFEFDPAFIEAIEKPFMAKRIGSKTIEIEASHLALISHPDPITNLILAALAV